MFELAAVVQTRERIAHSLCRQPASLFLRMTGTGDERGFELAAMAGFEKHPDATGLRSGMPLGIEHHRHIGAVRTTQLQEHFTHTAFAQ